MDRMNGKLVQIMSPWLNCYFELWCELWCVLLWVDCISHEFFAWVEGVIIIMLANNEKVDQELLSWFSCLCKGRIKVLACKVNSSNVCWTSIFPSSMWKNSSNLVPRPSRKNLSAMFRPFQWTTNSPLIHKCLNFNKCLMKLMPLLG